MKKYTINRIKVALAFFIVACGYCVLNTNPFHNILIIGVSALICLLVFVWAISNPTESEKRTIRKLLDINN